MRNDMAQKEPIPTTTRSGEAPVTERLKALNKTQHFGVLATNDKNRPYTSLIAFALTPDMRRVIFATPKGTRKFHNILITKSVSILIDNRSTQGKRLMETEAITIIGKAKHVIKDKEKKELLQTYLKKHPALEEFVQSESTALIMVKATRCIHVDKFQTVSIWNCCSVG
jgi:heme iron utilization protein